MKPRLTPLFCVTAAGLALLLAGCPMPNLSAPQGSSPGSAASARAVLPGTSTPAVQLLLPQGTAFAILGHSCGGIQEQSSASGFDTVSGNPFGDVHIQTRCGGSGRGGGYHTTTYAAWVSVTWDFTGAVVSSARLDTVPVVTTPFTATDAFGDSVSNVGTQAYLVVPVPGAPTSVTAVQVNDQLQVAWTTNGVNPVTVTSSTLTAAPSDPGIATLTATASGFAATGLIGPLQPSTTYLVTVVTSTVGGSSAASDPVTVTTAAASTLPSAPTGVTASWAVGDPGGSTDTLIAGWVAAVPGDSPIDQYEVTIVGSDSGGTFTQVVDGTTLAAYFSVDFTPNWTVTVRAHNAVGWGPSSAPARLGGL